MSEISPGTFRAIAGIDIQGSNDFKAELEVEDVMDDPMETRGDRDQEGVNERERKAAENSAMSAMLDGDYEYRDIAKAKKLKLSPW